MVVLGCLVSEQPNRPCEGSAASRSRLRRRLAASLERRERQEPTQDSKFHLAEVSCKTFTEFSQQEQAMIMSWLQGYYLPEHAPAIIDLKKLLSDKAKLTEHCINQPEDDLMTAAEAVMRQ
jgi:hypothetical protein